MFGCMFGCMPRGSVGLRARGVLGRGGVLRCGEKSPGRKGLWCTPGRSAGGRVRGAASTSGGGHRAPWAGYMLRGGLGVIEGAGEISGGGHGVVLRLGARADAEDTLGGGHGVEVRCCIVWL